MTYVDIIYFFEHAARELDVACLFKYYAERDYGVSVELCQWPCRGTYALKNFVPKMVILPFCYQEMSHNFCLLEWRDAIYFNLSWEELFYPGNATAKTPRNDFATKHVLHHAWSNEYAEFLKGNGVPENHIYINGNPTYALYQEPYRHYYMGREQLADKFGLDAHKKWIFFPENYNWAFYSDYMLERFIQSGQSPEQVAAMKNFCSQSFEAVVEWCSSIVEQEGVELILRPRPATHIEDFSKAVAATLGNVPNGIHILQDQTVREWILASDMIVSSHSTSLIEAAISGKPTFMLQPYPLPADLSAAWHQHLTPIKTKNDFLEATKHSNASRDLKDWAEKTMMCNGDPIINLCKFAQKVLSGDMVRPPIPTKAMLTVPSQYKIISMLPKDCIYEIRRLKNRVKRMLAPNPEVIAEYEKDQISENELNSRILKWNELLKNYSPQSSLNENKRT